MSTAAIKKAHAQLVRAKKAAAKKHAIEAKKAEKHRIRSQIKKLQTKLRKK